MSNENQPRDRDLPATLQADVRHRVGIWNAFLGGRGKRGGDGPGTHHVRPSVATIIVVGQMSRACG